MQDFNNLLQDTFSQDTNYLISVSPASIAVDGHVAKGRGSDNFPVSYFINSSLPMRALYSILQERWSRIFTVFDNGQSNIVSRRPRRLAYGRRIRCMRRRVIVDLASAGPLEVKFIITLRRSTPVIEYRRFELGPPGESKLPLSNREYTDFFENSQ